MNALPAPRNWHRGLYAITPACADDRALLAFATSVLAGGAALLQYRGKDDAPAVRARRAAALAQLCRAAGVPLVVNDDLALAQRVGAGVHVGGSDAPVAEARARLGPDAIVGASCYGELARARRAREEGASYVAFGAFFPSPTKPGAAAADPALLRQAAALGLPRVAIGGIRLDNAATLVAAGADLVAVISDLADHPDPAQRAAAYAALFALSGSPP